MTILYGRGHPAITLEYALAGAGFADAVALLSAPHAYHVAQVRQGRCHTHDADPAVLDAVFDARVFDEGKELRWLNTTGTDGRAVLLTEDPDALPEDFGDPLPDLHAVDTLATTYVLWGSARPGTGPWTTLHTPRIGTLHIPVPSPRAGSRLRLVAREYVCVEARHGNAHIAEERLLRIEPAEPADTGIRPPATPRGEVHG